MRAFVYLEILAARKDLATSGMGAGEGFLAGMDAYVIDQLVFGLEGSSITRAADPETGVCGALGSAHMLHGQMRHDLVHGVKDLVACLASTGNLLHQPGLIWIYPQALHLLLNARRGRCRLMPHVAQKSARSGRMHCGHGMMRMGMGVDMGCGRMMMGRMHGRRKIAVMMMLGIGMRRIGVRHAHLMLVMMMMMTVKRMLAKAAAQLRGGCLSREAGEEHRIGGAGGTWRCGRHCSRCAGIVAGIAASAEQKVTWGIAVEVAIAGVLIGGRCQ